MQDISMGVRVPHESLGGDSAVLRELVREAEDAGLDRLCVGDHVSFRGGQGFDGLIQATALAVSSSRLTVQTTVYLLPLRHPVAVARQVASLAALAPGRFVLGVGVGGEDPAEYAACEVDPRTRGRRMDESLGVVRDLLAGRAVTSHGEFFDLDEVQVLPAPETPVPVVVGGRSAAAVCRTATLGDGWLGVWVSPQRFASVVEEIAGQAEAAGRGDTAWQHGMHVWCGLGTSPEQARPALVAAMESLYRVPFENFARYSPCGTPADVAAALQPYVEAGCRSFNLIPVSDDPRTAAGQVAEVRALLRAADR